MGWSLASIGSNIFRYMSGQIIYLEYGITASWPIDGLSAGIQ